MAPRTAGRLVCVAALALAGCSTKGNSPGATVTVTAPTTSSIASATGTSTASSASATASRPVDIPSRHLTKLPGRCDDLLPLSAVEEALGHDVKGKTAFVVGVAEKDIGRVGYINCRYGLPTAKSTAPTIEIGVSLYGTSAQAARRIPATVDDYTNHNATATQTTIGDVTATVLTDGAGTGYAAPTIVAAAGQRTVAITIAATATTDPTKDLTALATLALENTG